MEDKDFVGLKEYLDMRIQHVEDIVNGRFISQEKAVNVARDAAEKRLDGMNEFRQTLTDQNKTFVAAAEFEAYKTMVRQDLARLSTDINSLNLSRAEIAGKASQGQVIFSLIVSILGLIISLAKFFIK